MCAKTSMLCACVRLARIYLNQHRKKHTNLSSICLIEWCLTATESGSEYIIGDILKVKKTGASVSGCYFCDDFHVPCQIFVAFIAVVMKYMLVKNMCHILNECRRRLRAYKLQNYEFCPPSRTCVPWSWSFSLA